MGLYGDFTWVAELTCSGECKINGHCPGCGICTETAQRNYRFFFMFVFSTTMLCLYIFAFCWVNIRKRMEFHHCNLWKALLKSPVSGILILYTCIVVWFIGGLTTFHLYLICTNQTTYENFRYRYDGKMNPYNLGWVRNVREIFFSKIPTSKNNFRAKVKEDPVSAFYTSFSMGCVMRPAVPKRSFDIEMGGKRQAVAAEDFQDIQNHIESVAALERCRSFDIEMGGKQQAVAAEDLEDLQNHIESVAALERCTN